MANLSKTKTLFAFTSPRTIEKILPEIEILTKNFSGQRWSGNQELQSIFFDVLYKSEYYEGDKYPEDAAFAARDRITRAPKALGFVDLEPSIQLTDAGKELLSTRRIHEIITRQLLKFQLPSPYHSGFRVLFNIRPYLELLRLIHTFGNISKMEIAIFFLQLIHYNNFDTIVNKIHNFRSNAKKFSGSRKTYFFKVINNEILSIYEEEISGGKFKTRESKELSIQKFIRTKRSNMIDYADAFIRYLRATQLITFEKNTYHLIISPFKRNEVEFILRNIPRDALEFKSEEAFKSYLFSPTNVPLLNDDKKLIFDKLKKYKVPIPPKESSLIELKDQLDDVEQLIKETIIEKKSRELKDFKEFDDILKVFKEIEDQVVPDPSLFLEWNVWRSFVMLNYAAKIIGNLILDFDGMPLSTAPAKKPDIEIDFTKYGLIVEVTMSTGETQFKMENESVPRHFGRSKEQLNSNLYCIFIAPNISSGTLAHYFNLNRFQTYYYGGFTKIIPLTIQQFIEFLSVAKNRKFDNPDKLFSWLEDVWQFNNKSSDEIKWYEYISSNVPNWLS